MTRRLLALSGALLLLTAGRADASRWPFAGGNASRSGTQAAAPGALPAALAWSAGSPAVRTPVVITGGRGPAEQRVTYGTADGRVHVRVLETGAPVGAPEGVPAADGLLTNTAAAFGRSGVSLGFADASTDDEPGVLYVVHEDAGGVEVARVDAATGTRVGPADTAVANSLGCSAVGSPVLTPAAPDGARILFLTLKGPCLADSTLVRIPIEGDAASPSAVLGAPTFAKVDAVTTGAAPSLVVLRDRGNAARFYVAVGRLGGVDAFDAGRVFDGRPSLALTPPDLSAALMPGDLAGTVSAPATQDGEVAGAYGSGTSAPPALYVSAAATGTTRVYRLVQDGAALKPSAVAQLAGTPGDAVTVADFVDATGTTTAAGLLVATSIGLSVLRSTDLTPVGQVLAPGLGTTVPAASGPYAFTARDGGATTMARPIAVRMADASVTELPQPAANGAGVAVGQPAVARGFVVMGTAGAIVAYRTRDVTRPTVGLVGPAPGARLRRRVSLAAVASDDRGVRLVAFRVTGPAGRRALARATTSGTGYEAGARFEATASVADLPPGDYALEALARDPDGNTGRARSRVEVAGCQRGVPGTPRPDALTGGSRDERLTGWTGDDVIRARGGRDCLRGGRGDDRLEGGDGPDVLDGGPGNDRLDSADGDLDAVRCGPGLDAVRADRSDEVARDCERVRRSSSP